MRRGVPFAAFLLFVFAGCVSSRFKPPVTAGTFIHDPQTHRVDGGIPGLTGNREDAVAPVPGENVTIHVTAHEPLTQADADLFRKILEEYLQRDVHDGPPRTVTVTVGTVPSGSAFVPIGWMSGPPRVYYSIADASGRVLESDYVHGYYPVPVLFYSPARFERDCLSDPQGPELLGAILGELHGMSRYIAERVANIDQQ